MIKQIIRNITTVSLSAGLLAAASGLTITSPVDGSAVSPGQNVAVTVSATGSFTEVVVVGEGPIGFSRVLTTTPYQFTMAIPARIPPGRYSLAALGITPGGNASSTPITLQVERTDAPVEIDASPETLNLPMGARMAVRVLGTYADGTVLDITHSAATSFSSSAAGVATVDSQGNVTAVSPGSAHILVNGSLSIPVNVPKPLLVIPQWPVLYASQSSQFSALQPGMAGVAIKWSINPQVGSISGSGLYTAPRQIATQQAIFVTATLKDDPTKFVSTGLALYPPLAVGIQPNGPVSLGSGQTQQFFTNVSNALDTAVDWSISPAGAGTIDNTGVYTAPATVKVQQNVMVTAASVTDRTKSARVMVSLHP